MITCEFKKESHHTDEMYNFELTFILNDHSVNQRHLKVKFGLSNLNRTLIFLFLSFSWPSLFTQTWKIFKDAKHQIRQHINHSDNYNDVIDNVYCRFYHKFILLSQNNKKNQNLNSSLSWSLSTHLVVTNVTFNNVNLINQPFDRLVEEIRKAKTKTSQSACRLEGYILIKIKQKPTNKKIELIIGHKSCLANRYLLLTMRWLKLKYINILNFVLFKSDQSKKSIHIWWVCLKTGRLNLKDCLMK